MPPKNQPGQKFSQLFDGLVEREEVAAFFKQLIDFVKNFKKEQLEKMAEHSQSLDKNHQSHMGEMMKEMKESGDKMNKMVAETKDTMRSESRTVMRYVDQKVNDLRDEMPEMPDLEAVEEKFEREMKAIEARIPTLPPEKNIEGMLDELWEQFQEELKKLREQIERLAQRPIGRGGGTSAMGVAQAFKYILKTEEPVGDIDGVNKTYTVSQPIFAVLSFSLNGETIAQLPNYTISGRTITFASALPSAFSGKDFEIKFI